MMPTPSADLETKLAPNDRDGRLARLGKLAALSLVKRDLPVTRSTLAAESKRVDADDRRRKPGFSEASFQTSKPLRAIYELSRSTPARTGLRRRGRVGAHILRMTKRQIAAALVVARLAALEREEEHRLALDRLGRAHAVPGIESLRETRGALPAAAALRPTSRTTAAASKVEAGERTELAISRGTTWAVRHDVRPTVDCLARRCGVHAGTVERHAADRSGDAAAERTYGFPVTVPPKLLRLDKWDLGRGLQVERDYIRALHAATMEIAVAVIGQERVRRRSSPARAPK